MGNLRYTQMKKDKKCKNKYYSNNNNCLKFGGKWKFTEIPRKLYLNAKWAVQRIKYGYCDYDVYDVDYWLAKTLSSALYRLADITHGYPPAQVAQYLHDKEDGVTRKDYDILDDEFKYPNFSDENDDEYFEEWQNIIREMANKIGSYSYDFLDSEECKKYEGTDEFYEVWDKYDALKYNQAKDGLNDVSKWFGHLWD